MRAAPGREAVGPVVLVGQQRRPFPVRHRSRRTPATRKRPQEETVPRVRALRVPSEASGGVAEEISAPELGGSGS